jgi:hypothetical protein
MLWLPTNFPEAGKAMERAMAEIGKPPIVTTAALVLGCGLSVLVPTAAMAQFPIPMIPNFNFGSRHYHSGPSHSSRSHSQRDDDKAPDKTKEKDATHEEPSASSSPQRQTSSPPGGVAPSGGPNASANQPTPNTKTSDDAPAFAPSR